MNHSTKIYVELFRRKQYDKIPIGVDSTTGEYYYLTTKQIEAINLFFDDNVSFVGYGGSARCFAGGTLVNTINGYKAIEDIKQGDFVLSYNLSKQKSEYRKVIKTYCFDLDVPRKLTNFTNINLKCTYDHEFLFDGKWLEASEIMFSQSSEIKTLFIDKNKEAREIRKYECVGYNSTENIKTYDLHVEGNENYTVTENDIIVHNSGKTILECFLITFCSLAYNDTGWFIGRKELKRLRLTVFKSLLKLFSFYGLKKDEDYKYNQQDSVITFNNKSDIFLLDLDDRPSDPEHLWTGGYEFTGGVIDESNECSESIIRAINARCGWRNNDKYKLPQTTLESFNPDKGHVNRRYWIPFRDKKEKEYEKFVRALPTDNPHPSVASWVKNLIKTGVKKIVDRLVYGNFDYDNDPTKLFDYQSICSMWTNHHVQHGTRYITCDAARLGGDAIVILVWSGWIIIDALRFKDEKLNVTDIEIKRLAKKHSVMLHNIVVDEDGVGGGLVDFCGYNGFVNNKTAKNGENYYNMKSQCWHHIARRVNNGEICILCEDSEIKAILVEDLEQIKDWNSDKDDQKIRVIPKDEIKKIIGRSTDCGDAFMMREYFELMPPPKTYKMKGLM